MPHRWSVYLVVAVLLIVLQCLYFYGSSSPNYDGVIGGRNGSAFCRTVQWKKARPVKIPAESPSGKQLESRHKEVLVGGSWTPSTCRPSQNVAILIPYRNRPEHLRLFLDHMHTFLQKQMLAYTIFLIQQTNSAEFNRGMLLNIGFLEATARQNFDCVVFHDVDLLPEDDRIPYTCIQQPRHLAVARSKHKYKANYAGYMGGVIAMTSHTFATINGFSNAFFAWGSEDDDLNRRMKTIGIKVVKIPLNIGKYKDVKHKQATKGDFGKRKGLVAIASNRMYVDGLASLNKTMYTVEKAEHWRLFTRILVRINQKRTWAYIKSLFSKDNHL